MNVNFTDGSYVGSVISKVRKRKFQVQFDVDDETVEKIRKDDEELLRFAMRYMKYVMMMEETMKPKGGIVEEWRARKAEENN